MEDLKNLIKKTLIRAGFSEVIPLEERENQLLIADIIIVTLWAVSTIFTLHNILSILLWASLIIASFAIEQLINIFPALLQYIHQRIKDKSRLLRSFYRTFEQRINLVFISTCVLLLLAVNPVSAQLKFLHNDSIRISQKEIESFSQTYYYYFFIQGFFMALLASDVIYKKTRGVDQTFRSIILSIGLGLLRGVKQIEAGFGIVAPGIVLAFFVSVISQELWQFMSSTSWMVIFILLGLLLLFIALTSRSIGKSVDEEIRELEIEKNIFSPEKLYRAVIRCTPYKAAKQVNRDLFEDYEMSYSWKLKSPLFDKTMNILITEMQKRALWQFWMSILLLMPLIFIFLATLTIIMFPDGLVEKWISGYEISDPIQLAIPFPQTEESQNQTQDKQLIIEGPKLKFVVVSTFLLLGYFASSYVQDHKRIFSNLHLETNSISDWLTLLGAYQAIKENNFQLLGGFYTPVGRWPQAILFGSPVLLVPNDADGSLVRLVIKQAAKQHGINKRLLCAVITKVENFLESIAALSWNLESELDIEVDITTVVEHTIVPKTEPCCWVWLDKGDQEKGLFEFFNFDDARLWASQNSKGGKV